jgi:crotonobetainyl-CoA:carnitine CoA-transferase CaiB-like acyl-CoA transferase
VHATLSRNKACVTLDLKTPAGLAQVLAMIKVDSIAIALL